MRWRQGFTLLELIVVVAILAMVAGGAALSLAGVQEQAGVDVCQAELAAIRDAVRRFKADTGFLPRQGPFDLVSRGGAVPDPTEGAAWFDAPANLSQLYANPLQGTGHALETWSPTRRRGWHGPYLSRAVPAWVVVDDGSGTLLPPVPAAADPFQQPAPGAGQRYDWTGPGGEHLVRGRPYRLFDLNDPARARVVGAGPDGELAALTTSTALVEPGSDDVGMFLLR